jgi:hypothetical protein
MLSFLTRFAAVVRGVLSGFDRLFFCGTLRKLSYVRGLRHYLWENGVRFQDFGRHSREVSERLEEASLREARRLGREVLYLNSALHSEEDVARRIAERDGIRGGPIRVLRSVDPSMSFDIHKNHRTRKLEIGYRRRKCVHLYHFQIRPVFGFMHARIRTRFPFRIYVCLNGREWLARQMDRARLHYVRRDNTFTWLEDLDRTQALFDRQLRADWPELLGGLARSLNPAHADIFARFPVGYYWSAAESEWAGDVPFHRRAAPEEVYRPLVRHAISAFDAAAVLRFLGRPVAAGGKVPHGRRHEVSSNVRERLEGVRIKHRLNGNPLKMYDKGSVSRVETMIHDPRDFKAFRAAEGDPDGPKQWRAMRRGVADLHRRAGVSQAANERYLQALAAVHIATPPARLAEPLCRPAPEPSRRPSPAPAEAATTPPAPAEAPAPEARRRAGRPRRARALNPLAAGDAALPEAVGRQEFLINGLRNRDLRRLLYGPEAAAPPERRRRAAAVTRQLRLLRAHGLPHKVPKTHRYVVSEAGRKAITALLAARHASVEELTRRAA